MTHTSPFSQRTNKRIAELLTEKKNERYEEVVGQTMFYFTMEHFEVVDGVKEIYWFPEPVAMVEFSLVDKLKDKR